MDRLRKRMGEDERRAVADKYGDEFRRGMEGAQRAILPLTSRPRSSRCVGPVSPRSTRARFVRAIRPGRWATMTSRMPTTWEGRPTTTRTTLPDDRLPAAQWTVFVRGGLV